MPIQKTNLFSAKKGAPGNGNVIPATVRFKHNKKKGTIEPLSGHEKMVCAVRKALAKLCDDSGDGCRYFIAGNKVQVLSPPSASTGRDGDALSYRAKGRCKVSKTHVEGHLSSMFIEFDISFRDVLDDRGLADVEYFDPTTIDVIPPGSAVDLSLIR